MTPTERLEAAAAKLEARATRRDGYAAHWARWLTMGGQIDRANARAEATEARALAALLREIESCADPLGTPCEQDVIAAALAVAGSVGVSDKEAGN
jgi:hypothetical protein